MLDRTNRFRQRRFKKRKREAKQSAKEHGKLKGGKYDVLRCCPQVWLLESEHIRLIAEDYEAFDDKLPYDVAIGRLISARVRASFKK